MRMYTASEAIGPAWEHTKALMWRDRRWGRMLKLSLLALGAELGSTFNFSGKGLRRHVGAGAVAASLVSGITAVAMLFGLVFYVVLLYLGSRLQLAQFDVLVLRDPFVAPAWERHGPHTWRWAGLKFVIMIGSLLVMLPLLIPSIPIFVAFIRAAQPVADTVPGQMPHVNVAALLIAFAEVFAILMVAVLLIRFITSLVLPGVALEDLRFGAALERAWQLFLVDVPGMLWFAVLQPLFLVLLGMVLGVASIAVLAVLALPFALIAFLVWHALHAAGAVAWFVLGTLGVLAFVTVGAIWLCGYLAASGTLLMFARAWSLYFLGGRYPLLGQYLEPSPAVPVWTPPPSMPRDDEGDGPQFPADPALA